MDRINSIIAALKALLPQLKVLLAVQGTPTPQGAQIYAYAVTQLGKDASPSDLAPDELGCAETVTTILHHVFPDTPILESTQLLYDFFRKTPHFVDVQKPLAGDIIISPTGLGGLNGITHGHTGIVGNGGTILSNDSATGNFIQNYTLASWNARWGVRGGYPVFFFRRLA